MDKNKEEKIDRINKLNVWVTKNQKEFIITRAKLEGTSVSSITRKAVDMYIDNEVLNSSKNVICKEIDKQIEISFKKQMDRIASLIAKSIISSESSNYNTSEILSSIKKLDINEVREIAYRNSKKYLKGSDFNK